MSARWLLRAVAASAAAVAALAASPQAAAPCGVQQVGTATVQTWCGPAKATVSWAGKTLKIGGGRCELTKVSGLAMFTVNVGRYTIPRATPKFTSFSAGGTDTKPGTYGSWLVSFQTPGKQWTLRSSTTRVTIAAGARKGTFSGKLYEGGRLAKGSWTC